MTMVFVTSSSKFLFFTILYFYFVTVKANAQVTLSHLKSSKLELFHDSILLSPQKSNVSPVRTENERYIFLPEDTRESLGSKDEIYGMHPQPQKPVLSAYERSLRYRYPGQPYGSQNSGVGWPVYPGSSGGRGYGDTYDYRTAPKNEDPGDFPYVVTSERLKEIRKDLLYPFFDQGGSDGIGDYQKDIHDSTPQIHKNFNFQLPFFGFRLNYTRVSMNGYLEFSDPPEHYTYPLNFPNQDWPKKNDPSFIGIFFSKCRIGKKYNTDTDERRPGVYFRLERDLHRRKDQLGVEIKERVTWDLKEGVVGTDTFFPKHVAIITWKNMSFAGGIDNSLYKTNTFQMVLATDEVFTYAIFNYALITWTSHTEAGGDTTGGEGGTPAFVGFNAGNGTRSFEYMPYSQASTLRDLTSRGWANGLPGRHIFRIDENILLGTCNKDIAGANLQLSFAPESGNMLGGTVVNITGPCFDKSMKVRCRFDVESVVGTVVDRNRAICVQPFLMAEGYVLFDIAIGDGAYNWKGKYFVETPATAAQKIFFETKDVHERFPPKIVITWDRFNLTNASNANVQISLWGYKETTIRPQLLYIDLLEENKVNDGNYTILPGNYRERDNYRVNDLRVGFIQINLTNPTNYEGLTVSPVLWSRPIPLGWYFSPQWERHSGSRWADKMCDDWIMYDRYLKNFAAEIPQCPCTLEQALTDKGRFMPDYGCDRDSNPDCDYNKGAIQCVRSGSPSLEGSEQQCCYDKNHYLMLSYDQQWGSRPRRSHNLGYIPWNEANKVPTLSQWFHDISPFYFCCLWQDEQAVGCETFRFERRPSQDCVGYQAPYVATVFGDPHVITFDGLEYTFNGKGEFVLVHSDSEKFKFDVQGRFEQLPNNVYGPVAATHLTSVAARDNTSAVIEVRIRPPYAQWRYRLDVFADGKRIYFDRAALRTQHFPGVTVYTPLYVLNQSEVIIMFESGAGVQVIENKGYMTARVYLPWKFINQTKGLFGTWDFDLTNEFILPDNTIAAASAININNFRSIHEQYAIKWLLEDAVDKKKGAALFFREYGRTASYYANRTFEPEYRATPELIIPTNRSQDIRRARELCGDSYQCKYDYSVSLNRELAYYTLQYLTSFTSIRAKTKERVITCGILETPRFGRKSNFLFVPGTKVTFECNQGFILVGDQRRTCTSNGRWDIPEFGYTECLREEEYDMRAIGSTVLIVILILLPLLLLIFCIGGHVLRKMHKDGSAVSWNYTTNSRRASLIRFDSTTQLRSGRNEIDQNIQSSPTASMTPDNQNRIPLTYDAVYNTNEPLPNKPLIEFEPKIWDITEDDVFSSQSKLSSPGSVSQKVHPSRNVEPLYSKPIKPKKQKVAVEQQQAPYRSSSVDYLEPAKKPVRSQSIETDIF